MQPVIQIENVSKLYKLGFYGADTFKDEVLNFFARLRGKGPVNSIVGSTNNLSHNDNNDYVWALKDINLTINQGDIVGIIGKNGAGKSTLLKLLSKITTPTTGSIKIKGRIASLLEVGTGMHQELTGRENIFLNGAILGMTKQEIKSKLDEIIDFAGIAKYIDTPIKRYSSGMRVRLGFAIAAFLEPEILVVDEVLAVGDAEFQKKAIGKMQDISQGNGRTVLFVSHNMTSIKNLCKTGVMMKNGRIDAVGNVDKIVARYLIDNTNENISEKIYFKEDDFIDKDFYVCYAGVEYNGSILTIKDNFDIIIELTYRKSYPRNYITIFFNDNMGNCIFALNTEPVDITKGKYKANFHVPSNLLNDGMFNITFMLGSNDKIFYQLKNIISFEINEHRENSSWYGKYPGIFRPKGFIQTEFTQIE
ncbi:MAG: polysaccharide ABC transporter ATP-binding protein [Bacteroidales bacterium]|nr:polysaccharide ABC transporter ATP-binding protein [Bacteroidales bacterium]